MSPDPSTENPASTSAQPAYSHLADLVLDLSGIFRPPERITVSGAAEKYRHLNTPGAYVGPWRNTEVPYLVEPMDTLTARDHSALIFAGPSQAGKTDGLILNWLLYDLVVDPLDMLIFCPTMTATGDFSNRRVDRLHRYTPEVKAALLPDRDADNKFEKRYKSGVIISLGWPSVSQFAGRPVGRIALTDLDRMPDDIDGDGSPFDLAAKRSTTFGSFAMTLAESSPSRPITNPQWIAASPHQAPPTTGILALYNRGDRRRLYWPCLSCGYHWEGNFRHLKWTTPADVVMPCPACGHEHSPDDRREMLLRSRWLKDGEHYADDNETVVGTPAHNPIASFWLNGVAAAFVTWTRLVAAFVRATNENDNTGSDSALQVFYNNELGEPYAPSKLGQERLPEVLKARAEHWPERTVPVNTRFLIATIDVQQNMFVVQVYGILPGTPFDMVVIDRFDLRKSDREDEDGERLWLKPAAYLSDWDVIIEGVIKKSYPLNDDSGRHMLIRAVGCDSGGKEGVTTNAYQFWRRLREEGLSGRFHLIKGASAPGDPRARITFPDASRRDKFAGARGDVPVLLLNANLLKDTLAGRLDCMVPGQGMFRFPDWLSPQFFAEMTAETRTAKGWESAVRRRNEAWDLSYYALGLCISSYVSVERIDWDHPPGWASTWDKNDLIIQRPDSETVVGFPVPSYDLTNLGRLLGGRA
jgi:phage terminase large subunit GpA-like protein